MRYIEIFKSNKGSTMVIITMAFTLLLGMCALVIDVGTVAIEKQRLQNAVDSASLAATQELPDTAKAINVANQYIQLNGYNPSDISVTFSDSNKSINISTTKNVKYFFAQVLGFKNTTVSISSGAVVGSPGDAFNYALFSGSKTINMSTDNTNDITINGSSHTNKDFIIKGANYNFTQAVEAVGTISVSGTNVNVPYRYPNSVYVDMPDYSSQIKQKAQTDGKVYNTSQTFSGNIDVSNSIYVNGNITLNSTNIRGNGAIFATGNITISSNVKYYSNSDQVCLYSNGNITINGDPVTIYGIMYAPNGKIDFAGGTTTIYGKIIANNVYFQGDHITINGADSIITSLPNHGYKLVK